MRPLDGDGGSDVKQFFFDVTNLRLYVAKRNRLSGIQRVTVMLIEHIARQVGGNNVFLSFHDKKAKAYHAVSYETVEALGGVLSADALTEALYRGQLAVNVRPTLRRYSQSPVKLAVHTAIREVNAMMGNRKHFEKRRTTLEAWKASAKKPKQHGSKTRSKEHFQDFSEVAKEGDCIILADAAWSVPLKRMEEAQARGISCYFLIHDLIQIKAPELIGGTEQSLLFHAWLRKTMGFVDHYLANSEATARDLREFLDAYGGNQEISVVSLAQAGVPVLPKAETEVATPTDINRDVYHKLADSAGIKDDIRALLKRPYVLCVGTMEARKNMWGLVQAWDRLRLCDGIELPKLVFAGNPGWLNQDFERFMAETGNLYGWVELVISPSDEELEFLYQNCLFSAMPSFFEGWGLPVGESLSYGKTAVVSQTSSLPEVGGDLVLYFDPHSISSITSAIHRMINEDGLRQRLESQISQTPLRGWEDVANDILKAIP